ncbi:hypothetical protein SESBI_17883 [Sesbania bispinosa]|nr:hypothetical protein SESBI_17883 [Sesbania bispinosa]
MDDGQRDSLDGRENCNTLQAVTLGSHDFELEAKGKDNLREAIRNSKRTQGGRLSEIQLINRSQRISQPSRSHPQLEEVSSCASRDATYESKPSHARSWSTSGG